MMNRNNRIVKILSLVLGLTMMVGCTDEWLDVNTDPNNAPEATAQLVFPAGVISGATLVGGQYNLLGGMWSQYWAQSNAANQYKGIDQYQIQETDFDRQWRELFAGCLSDLHFAINQARVEDNISLELMATISQIYFWQFAVDLYGAVPYFDAFKGITDNNLSPKYDEESVIYDDLIIRINAIMEKQFNELTDDQKEADFLFGGDIDKWIVFANTLKLKIYLRQMYVRPDVAEQGIEKLYADGVTFLTTDAAITQYSDAEFKDNPLYADNVRKLNVGTNLRVSSTIYRYFEGNDDLRLGEIVGEGTEPMPQGGFNILDNILDNDNVAVFALSATAPVYLISEVESYLLQAEAIAMGWGSGDDKALYEKAIKVDFNRKIDFEKKKMNIDTVVSELVGDELAYDYPEGGTFEEKQEAIIMAKWAAMAGSQGIESFFERNRTGYPVESPVLSWDNNAHNTTYVGGKFTYSLEGVTNGVFPVRLLYPQAEANLNTNFPGQTKITDPVWWDVKP